MTLNKFELLELLKIEKLASDDTYVSNMNFSILLDKLSLSIDEKEKIKKIYHNERLVTEKEHINKIAQLLDNKIEIFTNDFWELLFFRKHSYHSQYQEKKWSDFNESYEYVKDVKKRVNVLKSLGIKTNDLENFLQKLTYAQDGYIDLWFLLKKKNNDIEIDKNMRELIINYGHIDPNDINKAKMLSYFKEIEELEKIYIKNHNTPNRRIIENELLKLKHVEIQAIDLFDEMNYHNIIYRKNITINDNALVYELNKDIQTIKKIINIINKYLIQEIYSLKIEKIENKNIFIVEGYNEESMNNNITIVKQAYEQLPKLLIKKEYQQLIKDNELNNEYRDFFKQYIKSAHLYMKINKNLPIQNINEIKNKI